MQLVSIIMAAYNAEKYLAETIQSVLWQTYPHWELIIVNDGSSDSTPQIVEKFVLEDPRIRLISQANKMQAAARNTGLWHASGSWILFLDADDLLEPAILEKMIAASKFHPEAGVIYTGGWIMYNDDKTDLEPYPAHSGLIHSDEMYRKLYTNNCIPNQSGMISRAIVKKAGMQNEEKLIQGCEDYDYWFRIALLGTVFYGLEEKLFYYRRHRSNMSSDLTQMRLANATVLVRHCHFKKENLWKNAGIFKPHIYPAVTSLLQKNRSRDAIYILAIFNSKIPALKNRLVMILILLFGPYAELPFRMARAVRKRI